MKKLLVLVVSAVLILSMAAVSLAEVTVGGEYKYDMYFADDSSDISHWGKHELLYSIAGDVSDSVYAFAKFKFAHRSDKTGDDNKWSSEVDEFYATVKQDWGTTKMGYFEYKFTPSRQELNSADKHVFPKTDATFEVDVPLTEALTVEAVVAPYAAHDEEVDDGAYALGMNYKTESWGAKVSYADFAHEDYGDLTAIDLYYMLNEDMKLFVDAVDYSKAAGK